MITGRPPSSHALAGRVALPDHQITSAQDGFIGGDGQRGGMGLHAGF